MDKLAGWTMVFEELTSVHGPDRHGDGHIAWHVMVVDLKAFGWRVPDHARRDRGMNPEDLIDEGIQVITLL